MTSDELIAIVREVIAEELEIPLDSLSESRSLRLDYGLDSVAAVNVAFALETRLGIEIDIMQFASVDSIRDLRLLLGKQPPR